MSKLCNSGQFAPSHSWILRGPVDLKPIIMSFLNFTVENCSCKDTIVSLKKTNTLKKTTWRTGSTTHLQLWSLYQICVPWKGQYCLGVIWEFASICAPLPGVLVLLSVCWESTAKTGEIKLTWTPEEGNNLFDSCSWPRGWWPLSRLFACEFN